MPSLSGIGCRREAPRAATPPPNQYAGYQGKGSPQTGYYPPQQQPGYYPPQQQTGYYPPQQPPGYYPPRQPGEVTGVALDSKKPIAAWQGSSLHNDVILNRSTWQNMTWRSMGAGIIDSDACAWFSDQTDPAR